MDSEPGFEPAKHAIFSKEIDLKAAIDLSALKGKTVLITGGASGFGAACARLWAQNGANIMIGDINTKLGQEVVADLRTSTKNENHHFFTCDVTQWRSQATFFKEAAKVSPHGGIDVVVANAGVADGPEGFAFETPPDYSAMEDPPEPKITRTININLQAVMTTAHLALSYLPRNPGSQPCSLQPGKESDPRDRQLILVSSVAGLLPIVRLAPYGAAKHGVVGLFRSLRITAPIQHGVRVNMINPYFVRTPMMTAGGQAILAGGGLGNVESVVSILTRFVTDKGIIGRGTVVGPQGNDTDATVVNLPHGGPVWDVYADDFGQTDLYTRRIVGLTNIITQARGWIGVFQDLLALVKKPLLG